MTINQLKDEIGKLNLADKLLLVEDVWDSIADDSESLPIQWHGRKNLSAVPRYRKGKVNLHGEGGCSSGDSQEKYIENSIYLTGQRQVATLPWRAMSCNSRGWVWNFLTASMFRWRLRRSRKFTPSSSEA